MTRTSRNLRRAVMLLCLAGAAAVVGATATPGLAQGPSPAQLAAQGWTCVVPPPVTGVGMACFNPGLGRPPLNPTNPLADRRPSYTFMIWTLSGEFGHSHLIRPDLYAGQPCKSTLNGLYFLNPRLDYYECLRPVGGGA